MIVNLCRRVSMSPALKASPDYRSLSAFLSTRRSASYYPVIFSECMSPPFYLTLRATCVVSLLPLLATPGGWALASLPLLTLLYNHRQGSHLYSLRLESDLANIEAITRTGVVLNSTSAAVQLVDIERLLAPGDWFTRWTSRMKTSDQPLLQRVIEYQVKVPPQKGLQVAWKLTLDIDGQQYFLLVREKTETALSRGWLLRAWL
jgi:hypothetical protein